jgi:hypothetical protein
MEAAGSSKVLITIYQPTWCQIPENSNHQSPPCEPQISQKQVNLRHDGSLNEHMGMTKKNTEFILSTTSSSLFPYGRNED